MIPMLTKEVRESLQAEVRAWKAQRDVLDSAIEAAQMVLKADEQLAPFQGTLQDAVSLVGPPPHGGNGTVATRCSRSPLLSGR
ncbi:MAG: hypothetical protein ACE5JZ_08225, partial [Kiloniellales bacterium]